MNPKLLVCSAAAAAALCGCASQSPSDFNNGPYAEFGFSYDYVVSPIAALSTDDAKAVLAVPSSAMPTGLMHRSHGVTVYETTAAAPTPVDNAPAAPAPQQ